MRVLEKMVLGLRPAPVASALADLLGLSKRRFIANSEGTFFVNPISEFGLLIRHGDHEPEMKAALTRYLSNGAVFLDLGANEGYFSVIASRLVGSSGRVIAVEPQSRLQDVLKANIAANKCENLEVLQVAVFSRNEAVQMRLASERNTGSTSLYRTTKYPQPREEAQGVTLGELLRKTGIEQCDLMKVDIEGAEYDVLMGAEDVLRRGMIKHIAVEYHDAILARHGVSGRGLHEWILGCGYRANDSSGPKVYSFAGE